MTEKLVLVTGACGEIGQALVEGLAKQGGYRIITADLSPLPDTIKAIQNSWPNLIAGQGGINVQSPLGIADVDPTLLSPGKERLVQPQRTVGRGAIRDLPRRVVVGLPLELESAVGGQELTQAIE